VDKVDNININHFPISNIWQEAFKFLEVYLKECFSKGKKTLLLLSGGSAVRLYRSLAKFLMTSPYPSPARRGENWNDFLALGQVDERFKPDNIELRTENLERSTKNQEPRKKSNINANAIGETGLWKVCEEKRIHYYLISQEGTLEQAADVYHQTISKLFKEYPNRAAILGIGEDCHTAGLLPGYEKDWNINNFIVGYRNNGQFPQRISLTPKALRQLDYAIIVAVGESKIQAIQNALKKENINNLNKFPAVLIRIIRNVDLFRIL